ncbi:hypothetical protein MRX96_055427 [Rhipicephalus microplus]
MAASTPAALDAGRDDIDDVDFREVDAEDLATSRDSNTWEAGSPRQREHGGEVALTLHQRKAQAHERKK